MRLGHVTCANYVTATEASVIIMGITDLRLVIETKVSIQKKSMSYKSLFKLHMT